MVLNNEQKKCYARFKLPATRQGRIKGILRIASLNKNVKEMRRRFGTDEIKSFLFFLTTS